MAATYEPIATQTLGSAAASVTFSSIPATYTDLIVIANMAVTTGTPNLQFYVNSDNAGTSYSGTVVVGNGSGALSNRFSNQAQARVTYYAALDTGFNSMWIFNFLNYANTTTNKTMLIRGGSVNSSGSEGTLANVSLWRSTAAINSINISPTSSTFITGSTFTLYGIKAA